MKNFRKVVFDLWIDGEDFILLIKDLRQLHLSLKNVRMVEKGCVCTDGRMVNMAFMLERPEKLLENF